FRALATIALYQGATSVVPWTSENFQVLASGNYFQPSKHSCDNKPASLASARECYPSSTIMGVPQRQTKARQDRTWNAAARRNPSPIDDHCVHRPLPDAALQVGRA
ncbi:MAG: hypothetical protein ACYCPO_12015, partial [Acidobacteriaceae bacterium]